MNYHQSLELYHFLLASFLEQQDDTLNITDLQQLREAWEIFGYKNNWPRQIIPSQELWRYPVLQEQIEAVWFASQDYRDHLDYIEKQNQSNVEADALRAKRREAFSKWISMAGKKGHQSLEKMLSRSDKKKEAIKPAKHGDKVIQLR
jgi:hypothetical protein